MPNLTEFIDLLPGLIGIFVLMLSTFLIGYFAGSILQKGKYKKIIKTLQSEVTKTHVPKEVHDIETIFTEIEPKIVEVVKKTQEAIVPEPPPEHTPEPASDEEIVQKARTSYITYTKNKPDLDFDNFGYADESDREDLTKINGIGPYIEQKLNEIGIYNYEQISRFSESDIRSITELIDFFPGRIERDNWVGQAKALIAVQ